MAGFPYGRCAVTRRQCRPRDQPNICENRQSAKLDARRRARYLADGARAAGACRNFKRRRDDTAPTFRAARIGRIRGRSLMTDDGLGGNFSPESSTALSVALIFSRAPAAHRRGRGPFLNFDQKGSSMSFQQVALFAQVLVAVGTIVIVAADVHAAAAASR